MSYFDDTFVGAPAPSVEATKVEDGCPIDCHKLASPSKAPTLRQKVHHFLSCRPFKIFMMALLLLDLILVMASVLLETGSLQVSLDECERSIHDCEHICSNSTDFTATATNYCTNTHGQTCHYDHPSLATALHLAEKVLAYISIGLLSFFLLERLVGIICEGLKFFSCAFKVFDFVVIIVSLVLEILFLGQPGVGLIAIGRFWRFVRIGHGFHEAEELTHPVDEFVKEHKAALFALHRRLLGVPGLYGAEGAVLAENAAAVREALALLEQDGFGGLLLGIADAAVAGHRQHQEKEQLHYWKLQ